MLSRYRKAHSKALGIGNLPYLELFARHRRLGWSQWGNQVGLALLSSSRVATDGAGEDERVSQLRLPEEQERDKARQKTALNR